MNQKLGIDLWSFNSLINVFEKMHNNNSSIIVISHQEKILNISDEIILLEGGQIVDIGNKDTVLPKLLNLSKQCKMLDKEVF